jgi:hypothetical protein
VGSNNGTILCADAGTVEAATRFCCAFDELRNYLDLRRSYGDVHRAGQRVTLQVQAESRSLLIWHEGMLLKTMPVPC